MTAKSKKDVTHRSFADGVLVREWIKQRTVYRRLNGTSYVRDSLKGQIELTQDGSLLVCTYRATSVKELSRDEFKALLRSVMQ